MADEQREGASNLSRRRFLAGVTATAGLVTTASGLTLLGGATPAAAAAVSDASVSVSVPFGSFATYSFANDVTTKKIGITMTYSPTDPKDAGKANAKAVLLEVFAPGVSTAGKAAGTASGPAGSQYFQIEKPARGTYTLNIHNWDSAKRTVSVTLKVGFVGGAAIALQSVAGVASTASTAAMQIPAAGVTWPFPYAKLDPEVVRKEGHKGYYAGGCMYGAFHAIITQLQKAVGAPFTNIPTDMMRYGEGGGVGWGTLCGAINGSAAAMNLVLGKDDYSKVINELFGWYTTTAFPSDISNQYAEQGKFLVEQMKFDKALPQSTVASPLCHASVTEWCQVAGVNVADPKRAERCGRLTGDVAAQAVLLLNQQADKTFAANFKPSAAVTGCTSCHNSKGGATTGGIVNTKMDCAPCHGEDPHKK